MPDSPEVRRSRAGSKPDSVRCGLIVNPVAGLGGRVGLKGTDGPMVLTEALARGATPEAEARATRALIRLKRSLPAVVILTGGGRLGEDAARAAHVAFTVLVEAPARPGGRTTAGDTRRLAAALEEAGVDIFLVAGGDGTARDVFDTVGDRVPLLGIPAGVKMHSALFTTSPALAGDLAARFLSGSPLARLEDTEIMDIDETAARQDRLSARLFGYCRTPFERALIQGPKSGASANDLHAIRFSAREIAEEMDPETIYLLGPGSTTRAVAEILGLPSTLLGVDAVFGGRSVGLDLSERAMLELMAEQPAKIIVGVVGGQGCLFGRGNQQFSAAVIRRIGRDGIIVLSGASKLAGLAPTRLFVDTGDPALDRELAGYIRVRTGPRRQAMVRVDGYG